MLEIKSKSTGAEYHKDHRTVQIEMTEEEFALLCQTIEGVSISDAARQIVEHYDQRRHEKKLVSFWLDNGAYAKLQGRAKGKHMSFRGYVRQLFADYFREAAQAKLDKGA